MNKGVNFLKVLFVSLLVITAFFMVGFVGRGECSALQHKIKWEWVKSDAEYTIYFDKANMVRCEDGTYNVVTKVVDSKGYIWIEFVNIDKHDKEYAYFAELNPQTGGRMIYQRVKVCHYEYGSMIGRIAEYVN